MWGLIAQSASPNYEEYGIIGVTVVSLLGGGGVLVRWMTSFISKQQQDFAAERKQTQESWQKVAQEWKDCHRETCERVGVSHREGIDKIDRALTELTQAIRENKR